MLIVVLSMHSCLKKNLPDSQLVVAAFPLILSWLKKTKYETRGLCQREKHILTKNNYFLFTNELLHLQAQ